MALRKPLTQTILKRSLFIVMILTGVYLVACGANDEIHPSIKKSTISGRLSIQPLYQVEVPATWIKLNDSDRRLDTREPIASWKIASLLVQFHNFDPALRIHPMQQIERWKNQAGSNAIIEVELTAHGGFGGYKLRAYQGDQGTIAYAFQLNETLHKKLNGKEEGADWTVKVTGTKKDLELYANEIEAFVNSLELIEPIR